MIGAIGEISGAIAVVVSLIYLARQVALSNRLAQADAWRTPISDLNSLNAAFGVDPEFREAIFRVMDGAEPKDLSSSQAQVADLYIISLCNLYEQLFREVSEGVLDQHALTEFAGSALFELPFVRANWGSMRWRLGRPFVGYVEARFHLSEAEASEDAGSEHVNSAPDG